MKNTIKGIYLYFLRIFCRKCYETIGTAAPITLKIIFFQKILLFNKKAYWPMHFTSQASGIENIKIGIGTAPGLSPGCYIQGTGKIDIGDYTIIAPNVGIISANHDLYDNRKHTKKEVMIGKYCWIGMNSIILPGVKLGDWTIVGAGSIVAKSFPEGYCVIAGNPAKIVKRLDKDQCVEYRNKYEYYGYIPKNKFTSFRVRHLNV